MEVKRFTGLFLMLLIVLASQEAVMPTEGRKCWSRSHKYRGMCFRKANCRTVCLHEGFTSGACMRRQCYCSKKCGPGSPPPSPPEALEPPSEGPQPPLAI